MIHVYQKPLKFVTVLSELVVLCLKVHGLLVLKHSHVWFAIRIVKVLPPVIRPPVALERKSLRRRLLFGSHSRCFGLLFLWKTLVDQFHPLVLVRLRHIHIGRILLKNIMRFLVKDYQTYHQECLPSTVLL